MFWKINKAACNLNFSYFVQLQFHIYLILSIVMDYLLFDNSKNQMCFKPRGQIFLLRILLHGNFYKKGYKKWIFLEAFWRWALLRMASCYLETIQYL